MTRTWTESDITFLRENYKKLSYAEIATAIGKTASMVKSQASNLKITTSRQWTDAQRSTLRELYPDTKSETIAALIGKRVHSVYGMAKKLGLKKSEAFYGRKECGRLTKMNNTRGAPTRFKKGMTSWNKGKKIGSHPNSANTQFKKGHRPLNALSVGAEVVSTVGYRKLKIAEPDVWVYVHRRNWEEAHGPIPPGRMIRFKDGDRLNCDLSNLELETRSEHVLRFSKHKFPPEIVPAMAALADLKREIANAEKQTDRSS
jgi:hypothetical protein